MLQDKQTLLICIVLVLISAGCNQPTKKEITQAPTQKPNIIFILADDLGYGDLSCYGQTKFETPNIDRLAKEGLLFTQHYAGSTVCAPSRSALLTGQHTGHTPIRGNKEVQPEGQWPLPDSAITLAEILKTSGYITGIFGKWGLGYPGSEGDPNKQGFDTFFGYNCQRIAHHYYPYHLWENQNKMVLAQNTSKKKGLYAPNLIHEKALDFIDENKDTTFFLYYPMIAPHAELAAPEEYVQKYRGKFLPETTYEGVDDGPKFRNGPYGSQEECHATFAAMIKLVDDQVGEILRVLEEKGLLENTLIFFSSDNGPHQEGGADPDYFDSNGILKGYKRDLYEGGIRVPMIAHWKGKITPGQKTEHISAFWDVLPTLAQLTNYAMDQKLDGISFLPTITGDGIQKTHEYLYWEFHEKGGRQATRMGKWKGVKYDIQKNNTPIELYDLSEDPEETNNLADQYPEIIQKMEQLFLEARSESGIFKFGAKTIIK